MGNIILHGGAGSWKTVGIAEKAGEAVKNCTARGLRVLGEKNALEAVVEAVKCMEDSGYLNAGVGSVLDLYGTRSLDAGIMTGDGLLGAVAGVRATRNPVVLAEIVAVETPHILIGGEGADRLALEHGLPPLPPPPPHVWERYRDALSRVMEGEAETRYGRDIAGYIKRNPMLTRMLSSLLAGGDTVGAVAVDDEDRLAAAVSTGGVILKLPGRIGDSPIPGAGFYATRRVACSATGYGEEIIRAMPCLRLAEYVDSGMDLESAAEETIKYATRTVGDDTMGFIAVDHEGRVTWRYNTRAMLVGYPGKEGITVSFKP